MHTHNTLAKGENSCLRCCAYREKLKQIGIESHNVAMQAYLLTMFFFRL